MVIGSSYEDELILVYSFISPSILQTSIRSPPRNSGANDTHHDISRCRNVDLQLVVGYEYASSQTRLERVLNASVTRHNKL